MKKTVRAFLRGLFIVLPVIITLALVRWILMTIERWLAPVLQSVMPQSWYLPGMALLAFVGICMLIGFSSYWRGFSWLWQLPGKILARIPGLSQVYGTVQDVFEVMSGKNFPSESVVMVKWPNSDIELIGIVTKSGKGNESRLSKLMDEEQLAVFLPMAYNIGGYMVMVPKSCTRSIDMSPAEALQLVVSGGLGKS